MTSLELISNQGLRIAVEGCGHGVLHSIYASVDKACEEAGWPGVDLLIIGGDFQAVRNANDLTCVSIPPKFRSMQDFHEYYSGGRKAPYLTIFVGGNHEASNYLFELYYGGWVAPNIYYMGAANVLRVGPLRIAGMSGIWKGYDYRKPHHERLPYNQDDVKSIYHTRELDVRKLLNIRTQVDVGISHDWPNGIEWKGDYKTLFRKKDLFEADARAGTLGNKAATYVMERLRPRYWFSAHLHVKYSAIVHHEGQAASGGATNGNDANVKDDDAHVPTYGSVAGATGATNVSASNNDEIDLDLDDDEEAAPPAVPKAPSNTNEISLDLDEEEDGPPKAVPTGMNGAPEPISEDADTNSRPAAQVPDDLRAQLPAAFTRAKTPPPATLPFPEAIKNKTTRFLALDKCLPHRNFLQLVSVPGESSETAGIERPVKLEYDKEWLAITRVFAADLQLGDANASPAKDRGEAYYRPLIEAEEAWIEEHVASAGGMTVPENFEMTAPAYDEQRGIVQVKMPREYTNSQTNAFCKMLEIPNPFDISEEERDRRMARGPKEAAHRGGHGGGRGRGRGGGRGRGRGGYRGGRH